MGAVVKRNHLCIIFSLNVSANTKFNYKWRKVFLFLLSFLFPSFFFIFSFLFIPELFLLNTVSVRTPYNAEDAPSSKWRRSINPLILLRMFCRDVMTQRKAKCGWFSNRNFPFWQTDVSHYLQCEQRRFVFQN